jgi:ribosomal protein S18 acetylase RimI-like enzyme
MSLTYQPKLEVDPKKEDLDLFYKNIDEFNISRTGESTGNQDIVFFIRNSRNQIFGGIRGSLNISGWLYIIAIWIDKENRNKGYGTMLMQSIEEEAKANGGTNSYLNTISFQAPEFYKKLGYKVFAELEKFHRDYSKIFLRKEL